MHSREETLWNKFKETGSVDLYIKYRKEKSLHIGENGYADSDGRSGNQGK